MTNQRIGIALIGGAAITASLDAFLITAILAVFGVVLAD